MEELQGRAVRLETIGALGETLPFAAYGAIESRVANAAVEPVIDSVVQVVGLSVGIANPPPGDNIVSHVGFVVAIGVLQKQKARRLRNDQAAVGKDEAGGDI